MVDHHCGGDYGSGGELPCSFHLALHPGDLLHLDLSHFHLRDLFQAYQGMYRLSNAHTLHSIHSHHIICPQIFIFFLSLSMLYSLASQIFKAHPLILNYEHLNDSLEDPFHPVKKVINVTRLPDGNVTEHHEIIERAYPNTALLSMCLMFGCFFIALYLRGFKTSVFLPGPVSISSLPFLF